MTSPSQSAVTRTAARRVTEPHSARLRLLQALWLFLVLSQLIVLFVSLPAYYRALFSVCTAPIAMCTVQDQLNAQALPVLQHAGFSLSGYALYVITLDGLTTLSFLVFGALIAWRRFNTWIGLFVSFLLFNLGCMGVSFAHSGALPTTSPDPRLSTVFALVGILSILPDVLIYPALSIFFATFPDGHFVPRWSWALIFLWVVNVFFWVAPANFSIGHWPPLLEAGWLSFVFGGSACVQLYRFLRVASPVQRQQIKWLLYGFVPVVVLPICVTLYMTFVPSLNKPGAFLVNMPNSFFLIVALPLYRFWYLPIPFCIGIALLRYRLFDIDVIIRRTLIYGTLTAVLATLYGGLVIGAQALIGRVDRQAAQSPVIIVATTLFIAALFTPLRHRLQTGIDRRFYRRKYDAQKTLAAFGATLRQEVDLNELQGHLVAVVTETMQPAHVSLWLRPQERRPEGKE